MLRLLGARVSLTATIQPEMCEFLNKLLPFLHLVDIEDDVLFENYIIIDMLTSDEDQDLVFTVKPLHFERGCSVLHQSRVTPGTRMGQNAILAPRSLAQGYVPDNCAVINCDVLDRKALEARPALKGCLGAGILRRPHHHNQASWMAVYAAVPMLLTLETAVSFALVFTYSIHRYQLLQEAISLDLTSFSNYIFDMLLIMTLVTNLRPALIVIAAKWTLIGKQQAGEVSVTDGLVLRYHFFDVCHSLYDLNYGQMVQMRFLTIFTPILNLYYAAMGARIPWSAILSGAATAQTVRSLELIDFHDEVYLAAEVVFRTHAVLWSPDTFKQRIIYQPITLKKEAFIGPNSSIMSGTILESRAGVMEGSLVPAQAIVKTGTAVVATGQRMPFKHDRDTVPSDYVWAYHFRMTLFLVMVRTPLSFFPVILSAMTGITIIALGYAIADAALQGDHSDGTFDDVLLPLLVSLPFTVAVRGVFSSYIGLPLLGVTTIIVQKCIMGGLAKEGTRYPYRGWAHSRWATCFALTRPMFMSTFFDPLWKYSKLQDLMWWCAGVKMGKFADCPMKFPAQPEISMIEVGEYSSVRSIVYGHAFGSGYLNFQRVRIGKAVTSNGFLISPGSTVPDGATIAPLTIISKIQEIKAPGQTVAGILPRIAERTDDEYNGIFIPAGSKVQPWRYLENDGDDIELGGDRAAAMKLNKPFASRPSEPRLRCLGFVVLLAFLLPSIFNGIILTPFMHDLANVLKAEATVKPLVDRYHTFEVAFNLRETHKWADVHRWAEQGYGSGRVPDALVAGAAWVSPLAAAAVPAAKHIPSPPEQGLAAPPEVGGALDDGADGVEEAALAKPSTVSLGSDEAVLANDGAASDAKALVPAGM